MTVQSILLRFSYFEHDWITEDIDGPEAGEAVLMRVVSEGDWFEVEGSGPEEFDTLDALAERAEQVIAGEWQMPAAAVHLPMEKLRTLIAEGAGPSRPASSPSSSATTTTPRCSSGSSATADAPGSAPCR
ncbi:hypothetical protein ACFQY4_14495 [Catellatospora bangladeshensis]|uniref:hypothetical protein n=1 Tax=Catellatospora bangladeshensis TaxID=310355 RepID=UPI00361243DD